MSYFKGKSGLKKMLNKQELIDVIASSEMDDEPSKHIEFCRQILSKAFCKDIKYGRISHNCRASVRCTPGEYENVYELSFNQLYITIAQNIAQDNIKEMVNTLIDVRKHFKQLSDSKNVFKTKALLNIMFYFGTVNFDETMAERITRTGYKLVRELGDKLNAVLEDTDMILFPPNTTVEEIVQVADSAIANHEDVRGLTYDIQKYSKVVVTNPKRVEFFK